MIAWLLFCQLTIADLTAEQVTKLISRLQSKAEQEARYRHYTRGTTYAAPSQVQRPHVPFTHRVMGGGWKGPRSRITIKTPQMTHPKECKCFPDCKCGGDCGKNCPCIFENVKKKLITSDLN